MKTFNMKKVFAILTIALFFIGIASFATYTPASCAAPGCNTKPPITDGTAVNNKVGAIVFGSTNAPTSGILADIYGILSTKTNPVVSFADTTVGGVYQTNSLSIDKLRGSSIAGACADASGNIVSCAVPGGATNAPITFTNPNTDGTNYVTTWTPPAGTSLIKVEMWGAGGAGSPRFPINMHGSDGNASMLKKVGDPSPTMQAGGGLGGPYAVGTSVFSAGQNIMSGQIGETDTSHINCYGGKGGSSYKIDGTVYGAGGAGGTFSSYASAATVTNGQDGSGYGSGGGGPGSLNCSGTPGYGGGAGSYVMSIISVPTTGASYQITVGGGAVNVISGSNYYLAHDYNSGNGANGVVIVTPNP